MWNYFCKIFLIVIHIGISTIAVKAGNTTVNKADTLFLDKKYDKAYKMYESFFLTTGVYSPAMLLKMAYSKAVKNDYATELFYLCTYYRHHPSKKVLNRMVEIAEEYDLKGYSYSDLEYVIALYKQYYEWILISLILFSILFCGYLVVKKIQKQVLGYRAILFLLFLTVVYFFSNYSVIPPRAVIKNDHCMLMDEPSAAGQAVLKIDKGHRITLLGKQDIWYRISWEGQQYFIRENNLSIIPESQPYLF